MSEAVILAAIFLFVLIGLYAIGVPVAFAIGLTAAVVMIVPYGPGWTWETFATRYYSSANSFTLMAIPFFILAGKTMNEIGMTRDIFDFAEEFVKPIRGGLGHVNVIVSIIFSGMSGAAVADAAGLGAIEYKSMTDRGYPGGFAAGITGASATIGPIIPPSIVAIVYGVTAQVSIGALFIAGVIPGLMMGVSLMTVIYFSQHVSSDDVGDFNLEKFVESAISAIPALVAPGIIIGGIMVGIFTPTEAAIITALYAILLGFLFYRSIGFKDLYAVIRETFEETIVLLVIIGLANVYGFVMNISGIPSLFTEALLTLTNNTTIILFLIVLVLLFLGSFMETISIIFIIVPILAPVFPEFGINPVSFGIIMLISLMIGLITPPFGVVLFVLESVTDENIENIIKGVAPFYIPLLAVLVLLIIFPEIIIYLPRLAGLA